MFFLVNGLPDINGRELRIVDLMLPSSLLKTAQKFILRLKGHSLKDTIARNHVHKHKRKMMRSSGSMSNGETELAVFGRKH